MTELLLRLVLPVSLAGTLFYGLTWLCRPLFARLRAGQRRAMLLVAGLVFLLPLTLLPLPGAAGMASGALPAEGLRATGPVAPVVQAGHALAEVLAPVAVNAPALAGDAASQAGPAASPAQAAGVVYLAGAALSLLVMAARYARLMAGLKGSARPVLPADRSAIVYRELCAEMGLRRAPVLCLSDRVSAPVLAGVFRPRILLPEASMRDGDLTFALRHELTHFRRGDLPFKLLMLLPCAVHWFNPVCVLLRREFDQTCEESCDESLARDFDPENRRAYAESLLAFAGPAPNVMVSGFATPAKKLKKRLGALMRPVRPSKRLCAACLLLLCGLLAAGTLAGCALSSGAASYTEQQVSAPAPSEISMPPGDSAPTDPADSLSLPEPAGEPEHTPAGDNGDDGDAVYVVEWGDKLIEMDENGALMQNPVPEATHVARLYSDDGHRGIDFNGPEGIGVLAAENGTVIEAGWHFSYGNYVRLDHGAGLETLYAHCETLTVEAGETVLTGQQIATVGSTGNSTGIHCHFEVLVDGEQQDPAGYVAVLCPYPGENGKMTRDMRG
ncbi:M23/M56 family metallopeptidase [Ruminococcaceae bacterium OttesenSCG-928-D13]|nr:M23/M56 family metallopeptidase [Ruminococcaceae bacterium OttesenSCG-928-D13]